MIDKYVLEDISSLVSREKKLFELFFNKNIFVTGATGLIGSQIVRTLIEANKQYSLNIKIYIMVRSIEKAKLIFGEYVMELGIVLGDISHRIDLDTPVDYVIHTASVTSSLDFIQKPVDTFQTVVLGTQNILEFAKEKNVDGFVYLSSLEVYGTFDSRIKVTESDFGSLDPAQVRSSYSEGKRMAETVCVSYASQYDLPVKIARLCQTFGPGVDFSDNRVFAQFARSVITKSDIVLHTKGGTERNYCSISDAIAGIFYILLKGNIGEAYNIANEDTMISIKDMAELVAGLDKTGTVKVIIDLKDISILGYNPEIKIKLLTNKLEKLGWTAKEDLKTMFEKLILSMELRENRNE